MTSEATLGVIAGAGRLPELVVQAARDAGRDVFVVVLEGAGDPARFADVPHAQIRIGAAGRIIAALKAAGVRDLVMAGGVKRPSFATVMPDARGARLLARVATRIGQGDDALLKAVVADLESEGFRVVGADQIAGGLDAPPEIIAQWATIARANHGSLHIRTADDPSHCVDLAEGAVWPLGRLAEVSANEGGVGIETVAITKWKAVLLYTCTREARSAAPLSWWYPNFVSLSQSRATLYPCISVFCTPFSYHYTYP